MKNAFQAQDAFPHGSSEAAYARRLDWRRLRTPAAGWALGALVLFAFASAAATIVTGQMATEPTARNFGLLASTALGGVLTMYVGQVVWTAAVNRAEGQLRADLLTAALQQPVRALKEMSAGEILDRVDDDTHSVGRMFRGSVWPALRSVVSAPLLWIVAGITWWPAWLLFPALICLVALLVRPLLGEIVKKRVVEEEAWTEHAAAFEEAITARDDLRTCLGQPFAIHRLAYLSANIHARIRDVLRVEIKVLSRTGVLLFGLLSAVAIVGAAMTAGGGLPLASLVTLFLATTQVVGVVSELVSHLPNIQEGIGALTRIRSLLDAEPEPVGGEPVPEGALDIEVRSLNFTFDDGQGDFGLRDVTLRVPAGQTIALVGRTGSGKSTLASMLSRAVDPPPGTLLIGGVDALDLNLHGLREAVGVVTQRTELLSGTLRENVTLYAEAPDGAVERAIADLGLTDWVAGLPDGLDTLLGAGGTSLSAGEEQLVAFARLLVRDVQVVVLDEATARMDPVTEARVVAASQRLLQGRTGVLVAHRLSTIERAELVAVLDHGKLSQFGPRAELAEAPGPYRDLLLAASSGQLADDALTGTGVAGFTPPSGIPVVPNPLDSLPADPDAPLTHSSPASAADLGLAWARTCDAPEIMEGSSMGGRRRKGELPEQRTPREGMGLLRSVPRQFAVHKTWGLLGGISFFLSSIFSPAGVVVGFLWGRTIAGIEAGTPITGLLIALPIALMISRAGVIYGVRYYPLWWIQLLLRIRMAVMRGQTEQRRLPATPPGEIVARTMDGDRMVIYADRWIDFAAGFVSAGVAVILGGSWLAGAVLVAIMAVSAIMASIGRPVAGRSAKAAADARARFGRVLVSALDAARTVKLSARTSQVHAHLSAVDAERVNAQVFEHRIGALLSGLPLILCNLGSITAWFLYLGGTWNLATTLLVSGSALGFSWYGIVAGAVITEAPGSRSWLKATNAFADGADLVGLPAGVSLVTGEAPDPSSAVESDETTEFERLDLQDVTVMHDDDGTIGVSGIDLTVRRGELVLLLGRVGSGKSSLLAALAGLMSHTGELRWNEEVIVEPETFLRPGRVAYVAQAPHVLSGTFAENIALGYADRDVAGPIRDARLADDVAESGGTDSMVGHRGVKLSGGQVQRLALARALAANAEVLLADDVSSALDAATEIELWESLRARGTTVIGSTSKAAALARADRVVVLVDGEIAAEGTWTDLAPTWGELAG